MHELASGYGWSEEQIFSLPLVRLAAYREELQLASGEGVVREYPELPEERALAELMKKEGM